MSKSGKRKAGLIFINPAFQYSQWLVVQLIVFTNHEFSRRIIDFKGSAFA